MHPNRRRGRPGTRLCCTRHIETALNGTGSPECLIGSVVKFTDTAPTPGSTTTRKEAKQNTKKFQKVG